MSYALVVENLRKEFPRKERLSLKGRIQRVLHRNKKVVEEDRVQAKDKRFIAVENVNFSIKQGEIFGLLGPNGAGKTTMIKMISTLLEPSAGRVLVHGFNVVKEPRQVRQTLGTVLAGERSIYWKLTERENLEYFAALYGMSRKEAQKRAAALLEKLELTQRGDELVENYSSGMKQRIALGKALIAEPQILLLDEPTVGLDPQAARRLREIVLELKAEGKTILLTTHYMEEADILSDRIAIIDQGKIIALDTPESLKEQLSDQKVIELLVKDFTEEIKDKLRKLVGVQQVLVRYDDLNENWQLTVHSDNGDELIARIIKVLTAQQISIQNVSVTEASLEDVFIHLTGKSLRE